MRCDVTRSVLQRLREEADRTAPHECCGLLLGSSSRIKAAVPARNIHPTPTTHFEIDPQALIDAHRTARSGGPEVIGYYHSHPGGEPFPSITDQAMATGDGRIWAIIGASELIFWYDSKDGFEALSCEIRDE